MPPGHSVGQAPHDQADEGACAYLLYPFTLIASAPATPDAGARNQGRFFVRVYHVEIVGMLSVKGPVHSDSPA